MEDLAKSLKFLLTRNFAGVYSGAGGEKWKGVGKNIACELRHVPVLGKEVLYWLTSHRPKVLLDCTVGYGGHTELLLKGTGSDTKVIGLDRDFQAVEFSRERLVGFGKRVVLLRGNYRELKSHLAGIGVSGVDGVLFDLGASSPQYDDPARGFSFQGEGPLDMRMDQTIGITAAELVNCSPENDLANIIYQYGEERYSRRIARAIVGARQRRPIATTSALASIISGSVPSAYRHGRIHCATRTFQALRIAVNLELEDLEPSLRDAVDVLLSGGRICVISFHSLEDRIVKRTFRACAQKDEACLSLLTKKPVLPTNEERQMNPRSRSAKLRVAERLSGKDGHMKMLAVFGGLCLVFLFVWERVDMVRVGYQVERLKQEKTALERERDELRVKLSALSAPDRIAKVAKEKLGMGPPQQGQVITVQLRAGDATIPRPALVEMHIAKNDLSVGRW